MPMATSALLPGFLLPVVSEPYRLRSSSTLLDSLGVTDCTIQPVQWACVEGVGLEPTSRRSHACGVHRHSAILPDSRLVFADLAGCLQKIKKKKSTEKTIN